MNILERGAIISGLGMSQIGRRTGIAALDLTVASSRDAIADDGLQPGDIDGVATMGDTPIPDACAQLGITPTWEGGFGNGGLLAPVLSAFNAVASGAAR